MVAKKTVWIQSSVTGRVSATAGQSVQNCCYLHALWHEDWNASNIDMTCKNSFLRQNNLFLILKKEVETYIRPGQDYFSCAALHHVQSSQNITRSKELSILMTKTSLLKITWLLLSAWNIFKGKHEIFACDCLKDAK